MTTVLLAAMILAAAQADGARWTFDGHVKDSGSTSLPSKAVGRLEFIDSPVAGKAAVFNGVDAYVQVDPPGKIGMGGDFTLSAWVFPLEKRTATLLARDQWSLIVSDKGDVWFSHKSGKSSGLSIVGGCHAGQWSFVTIVVKRSAEGERHNLFVNAGPMASVLMEPSEGPLREFDPAQAPLFIGKPVADGKLFCGLLDEVRLRPKALSPQEIARQMDLGMPWLRPKPHAAKPFPGKFELHPDDVLAFVGGENARVGLDQAYLETLLSLRSVGKTLRFRNMAWEGDTVYEQPRPLNFGSWSDQFRRTGTSVIFLQFGQIEALEGKAGVERFAAAYDALLAEFGRTTRRLVLLSPTPFGKGSSRQPDLTSRNEDLKLYVDAIRKLATKHEALFIDLSTSAMAAETFTRNGLHLTTEGQWAAARETARQLEIAGLSDLESPDATGAFRKESLEKIRVAIRSKNGLWNDAWRPTNWAFLSGDRMEQPSSRDHLDRRIRWFPVEVQQLPAMVLREEAKIEALLQAEKK